MHNQPELRRVFAIANMNGNKDQTLFLSFATQRLVEPNEFGAAHLANIKDLDPDGEIGLEMPTAEVGQQIFYFEGRPNDKGRRASDWGIITPSVIKGLRRYRAAIVTAIDGGEPTSTPVDSLGHDGLTLWELEAMITLNRDAIIDPANSLAGGSKYQGQLIWQTLNAKSVWVNCLDPRSQRASFRFQRAM